MGIFVDITLVLIIVCSVYRGYKKGIVDIGFKLIAFIVSLMISLFLYSPITNLIIENTDIDEKIEETIVNKGIMSKKDNNDESKEKDIDFYIKNYTNDAIDEAKNSLVETVSKPIAKNVIGIAVIIILFIGSRIILIVLKTFTDIVSKLPIIRQFNEFAGLIYGLVTGLILIYTILAMAFFIISVSGNTTIKTAIDTSYVTKYLYDNNIILKFLF